MSATGLPDAPATISGTADGALVAVPRRILAGGSLVRSVVAPLVFGAAFLGGWQLLVTGMGIEPFVLPSPAAIGAELTAGAGDIAAAAAATGANALIGLVAGTVLGVLGAVLANLSRIVDGLAVPIVAALSVLPIVALAPVLYTMYGADVDTARQLVAGLAVLIPVYLNTLRGLRQVRAVHRDLMHAYAAGPVQRQLAVTLPTAVPYLFTGLRIASSLAVISALVAEYFGGPITGLGRAITTAASGSDYPLAWAYVFGAIVLGLIFYGVALGLETWVTRHRRSG